MAHPTPSTAGDSGPHLVCFADGSGPASLPGSPLYRGKETARFAQGVPRGEGWKRIGSGGGKLLFANAAGDRLAVPAVWYNFSPAERARAIRWNAERCDECAAHHDAEAKPWSPNDAAFWRRQARRLRAMAKLCDLSTAETAGEVDFRGLDNPGTSQAAEDETIREIEAMPARAAANGEG